MKRKTKKPTREEAKALVLEAFRYQNRPVLVGPVSLRLGPCWGLDETESLFEELVHQGKIRKLTEKETYDLDCHYGYVLTGRV